MTTVNFHGRVFSFGGAIGDDTVDTRVLLLVYESGTSNWSRLGTNLRVPRAGHSTLIFGEKIVHIGGNGTMQFEVWTALGDGKFRRDLTQMTLVNWFNRPNAFSVDEHSYE